VLVLATPLFGASIAAVLALTAGVMLTGGFHEDGLADSFDALGGVVSRERALEILKDSRIGSYGALALGLSLMLRALLLMQLATLLPPLPLLAAVAGLHGLARWAPVLVMAALPYGGDLGHAKAKPLALGVTPRLLALACLLALPAALLLPAPLALLGAPLAAGLWIVWLRRRLGGYTGDGLGACEQTAELLIGLALVAALRA
jgi:adenosylcobinamide-GDP ribazoletransferase